MVPKDNKNFRNVHRIGPNIHLSMFFDSGVKLNFSSKFYVLVEIGERSDVKTFVK